MRLTRRGKRRLTLLAAVIIVGAGGFAGFRAVKAAQKERLVAEARTAGLEAYRSGDLDTARDRLGYFFSYTKNDLEVNLVFADAITKFPRPDGRHLFEAIDLYTTHGVRLIDRQPSLPDRQAQLKTIHERLLDLYGQLGMRFETMRAADEVLAIDPSHVEALAAKAKVLLHERRFSEAEPVALKLIELEPDRLIWRSVLLEVQRGRGASDDQLIAQTREWAEKYEGDGRFRLLVANLLLNLNEPAEAQLEMERAALLGANDADVLERAVTLLDLMEMRVQADDLIERTRTRFPNESWVAEVGVRRLWHGNRADEALAELERLGPDQIAKSSKLQRLRALVLLSNGQHNEAQAALHPLLQQQEQGKSEADRAWAQGLNAAVELSLGSLSWKQAEESIQQAIGHNGDDPVLHFVYAEACANNGEFAQAVDSYGRAFTLEPNWVEAGLACSQMLLATGRIEEAFEVAREVLSRSAKDRIGPFVQYARAYLAARAAGLSSTLALAGPDVGREMVRMLEQLRHELPDDPEIAAMLVQAHAQIGNPRQAAQAVDSILNDSQVTGEVLLRLARVSRLWGIGREDALLDKARQTLGPIPPVALAQAELASTQADLRAALHTLDQALAQDATGDEMQRQLSCARVRCLLRLNDANGAAALDSLVQQHADDADVQRFALGLSTTWSHQAIAAAAIDNLARLLGDESPQVRLARANLILHHQAGDDQQLAKAIVQINEVLNRWPHSLAALSLMAEALTLGNHPNLARAIEMMERAAGLFPGDADVVVRLIDLLQQKGEYEKAGQYLQRLAQLSSTAPQLRPAELRLLQAQGDFNSALARATSIIDQSSSVSDQLVLATMHVRTGRLDLAQTIYDRLLAENAEADLVLAQAAEFYARTGRFERGLELLKKITLPAETGEAERLAMFGAFHLRHGRVEQAAELLKRAVQQDAGSASARHAYSALLLSQRNFEQAKSIALEGLRIEPAHPGLRGVIASAAMQQGSADVTAAIQALREIDSKSDDLLAMLMLIEAVNFENGKARPSDANLAAATRLVDRHGGFLPCWQLAASLHADAGYVTEAVTLCRRAASRFRTLPEPANWATQLLLNGGRWDEAISDAREWRRRSLHDPLAADCAIAHCHLERGHPFDAAQQLASHADRIIAERAQYEDRFALLVRSLARSGDFGRAQELISPLLTDHPKLRQFWLGLSTELDPSEAYDALNQLEPLISDPRELLSLAAKWVEVGRRSGRDECLERALVLAAKSDPTNELASAALIVRGAVAEARDQWPQAVDFYRQALQHDDKSIVALNNLAFALTQSDRHSEALPLIERALAQHPGHPDLLDTYAIVLLGLDRAADAENALRQALDGRPHDVGFTLTLIHAHLSQNRFGQAAQMIDEMQRRLEMQAYVDPQHSKRLESLRAKLAQLRASAEP